MPEHFQHRNRAESLTRVWLASDDFSAERRILARMGASIAKSNVRIPERATAEVVRFADGEILLLPPSVQWIPDRRVVGATLRTRDLSAMRSIVSTERLSGVRELATPGGRSLFVTPELAHGIRLEFQQPPRV